METFLKQLLKIVLSERMSVIGRTLVIEKRCTKQIKVKMLALVLVPYDHVLETNTLRNIYFNNSCKQ